MSGNESRPALDGVRILDFGQGAAAPWCTQLLTDLGADTLKIEPPGGDWARELGPPFLDGEATAFLAFNRGKRSLTFDLKSDVARAVAIRLAEDADVFIENLRPGTMERLGLGYETLQRTNPRLVYCSISGFGQRGPWRDRPAVDGIIQAMSGFMSIIGSVGDEPTKAGVVADMFSGTLAAVGVLAALHARVTTGVGQRVDVSLLAGMLALQTSSITAYLNSGELPDQLGTHAPYAAPNGAYATADGVLQIAAYADNKWAAFLEILGRQELLDDPRFRTNQARVTHRAELKHELEQALTQASTAEWLARFEDAGIAAGPILDYGSLLDSEHVASSGDIVEIEHPVAGAFRTVGLPMRLSESPVDVAALRAPPVRPSSAVDLAGILESPDPWSAARALAT